VVVDSGRTYDPTTDRMFVIGKNGPDTHHGRVNGLVDPAPETLTVGTTYRFRIVEINPDWRVFASLRTDSMPDSTVLHWRPVAKDGADLPAHQATMRLARVLMGAGETADFEFTPTAAGMLRLEFTTMVPGWTLAVPLHVRATGPDHVAASLHHSPQQRL
jgi:manganese oxidase